MQLAHTSELFPNSPATPGGKKEIEYHEEQEVRKDRCFIISVVMMIVVSVAVAASSARDGVSNRARESLLALRLAADVVEIYADEHFVFPGPTNGLVPLASLRQTLDIPAPRYFPGRLEHLYWSNGTSYLVISTGADAAADAPYQTWTSGGFLDHMPPGSQTDLRKDILFGQGQFIQWPTGIVT